jgi:putative SOS response-associated peptidase YedK
MCGRFFLISPFIMLTEEFDIRESTCDYVPSPEFCPGQDVHAVVPLNHGNGGLNVGNRLAGFRWGLIPSWAKDASIGSTMFNARSESLSEKPSFRDAFRHRRCLILADGFYEWRKTGKLKTPYLLRLKSRKPFGFAGLFEKWMHPSGAPVLSCTIITTTANEVVAPIHDRMPVIVSKELERLWLNPVIRNREELLPVLKPYAAQAMEALACEKTPS